MKNKVITQVLTMRNSYVQYYTDGTMRKFRNVVSVSPSIEELWGLD